MMTRLGLMALGLGAAAGRRGPRIIGSANVGGEYPV